MLQHVDQTLDSVQQTVQALAPAVENLLHTSQNTIVQELGVRTGSLAQAVEGLGQNVDTARSDVIQNIHMAESSIFGMVQTSNVKAADESMQTRMLLNANHQAVSSHFSDIQQTLNQLMVSWAVDTLLGLFTNGKEAPTNQCASHLQAFLLSRHRASP